MTLIKHIPALQVLIPFFGALFAALAFYKSTSWFIATIAIGANLILGIYAQVILTDSIFYTFGNWNAPIGIEYRLDALNQPIIIYLNSVLLFFLVFGKQLINQTITKYIDSSKHHMFYSLLLFAHAGYIGVLSTNDLFNIYVFIEISSLATYVLMSKGNNPKALIGSFDYLIMGTIGATLILISIGFFFAITGSLNISDIAFVISNAVDSKIVSVAIVFFLTGAILKMAFFPLHFWMVRTYSSTAPFILTYLAAISSVIGIYLIMRFMHFVIEPELVYVPIAIILRFIAMGTILICTYLALKAKTIKMTVVYSSASQIGYIFLLLSIWSAKDLLFQLLILDGINKIGLFTLIAHMENTNNLSHKSNNEELSNNNNLFKILSGFILLFSACLPITSMFFVKIKLLDLLIAQSLIIEFIVVLIGSGCALLYHIKIAKTIFFELDENGKLKISTNQFGLIAIIFFHAMSLMYMNDFAAPSFMIQ